jgi:hypothetical protein
MKRKFTTKISSIIAMVFVFMLSSGLVRAADLSGTYQVGASQTLKNLTDIAAQLNAGNLTGNVIYELNADYAGGETFPVTFTQFTQNDPAFTATIRLKSGAGAITTSGADTGTDPVNPIPLIKFNGVDNLIFDGREGGVGTTIADNKWTISNTNNKGTTFMFLNDAIGNTLKYCNIQGRNYSYLSGTIVFGGTIGTVGNDNNTIDHCAIYDGTSKPNTAIYSAGQTSALANSENTISNNYIYNFTTLYSQTTTCGINLKASSSAWTITDNSIYQPGKYTSTTYTATIFGIRVFGVYGHTITGNYIGGSLPNCGGAAWTADGTKADTRFNGIYLAVYNSTLLDSYVQDNTIGNFDWTNKGGGTAPSEGSFCAINISGVSGQGTVHVENNTIGGAANSIKLNSITNAQTLTGIFLYGTTLYTSSNTISGLANLTAEDIGTSVQGIAITGLGTGTYNIYGNKICGLNLVSPSASAEIRGINFLSGTSKIYNNDISLGFSDCGSTPITDGVAMTGIYVVANNTASGIYFNTVKIGGAGVAGSLDTYAFRSDVTTNSRNTWNNIFYTDRSNASGTGKYYAVRVAGTTGLAIDYNDYYATGSGAVLGFNGADIADLAAWKTSTGQDAHSISVLPTDLALISGFTIGSIPTDFNGTIRAGLPTIGAYEFSFDNKAPVANAGVDQSVNELATVDLDGSASSDPDGNPLTFKWTAPVGITLSSTTVAKPTFTAPEVTVNTSYTFTLVVNDGQSDSPADEVVITVLQVNKVPTADAGTDQSVNEDATVSLDGSASSDPDGNPLTFKWTAPAGITLSSTTAAKPTFTAPEVTEITSYTFTLVVNNGTVDSPADMVVITVANIDKAPYVKDPIKDVVVDKGAPVLVIDLKMVFADDDVSDVLSYSVSSNSNVQVVTAIITNSILTLSFSTLNTGNAEITITASSNGENVQSTFKIEVKLPTGISRLSDDTDVQVYPNPTSGNVQLKFSNTPEAGTWITVYSISGEIISKSKAENKVEYLNLKGNAAGSYFIRIDQKSPKTYKLVLE